MSTTDDGGDDRMARLALELVVRRLALRVRRNHPRAFDDLDRDLERSSPSGEELEALKQKVATLVGKSG